MFWEGLVSVIQLVLITYWCVLFQALLLMVLMLSIFINVSFILSTSQRTEQQRTGMCKHSHVLAIWILVGFLLLCDWIIIQSYNMNPIDNTDINI